MSASSVPRWLRPVTRALREIPGMGRFLEPIRHRYRHVTEPVIVTDFDRTLTMEVRLDEHMGSQIFWYGSYSREILKILNSLLRPGMTMVDAGANIGEVTLYAGKRVGATGHLFAFEPVPAVAAQLRRHVSLNGLTMVEVREQGLSSAPGHAEIFAAGAKFRDGTTHTGLSTLYANADRGAVVATIELTTLDRVANERALQRLDLLKLDVEGAELPLLRGATATLQRFHPWIIAEVQRETSRAAGYHHAEILTFLDGLGYRFARIDSRGGLSELTAEGLEDFQNVLGIPPGRSMAEAR